MLINAKFAFDLLSETLLSNQQLILERHGSMPSLQIHGQDCCAPLKGNSFCKHSNSALPISINNLDRVPDSVICRSNSIMYVQKTMSFLKQP